MVNFFDDPAGAIKGGINDALPVLGKVNSFLDNHLNLPPQTATRTTHALALYVTVNKRPRPIGAVQSFASTQNRTVDEEYEIEVNSVGLPRDLVPQVLGTRTLTIKRYDLYTSLMEEVFGDSEFVMLTDQATPFTLRKVWTPPSLFSEPSYFEYRGCYFTSLGRSLSSTDTRISGADATIVWKQRVKL